MYYATRQGGLRLAEVVAAMGIKYQAAAQGVKRFGGALADPRGAEQIRRLMLSETHLLQGEEGI
jgi:hypothetical protein